MKNYTPCLWVDEENGKEMANCVNCDTDFECDTDIQLCHKCMDYYDTDKLWELHDNNELDALDFNENYKLREQFRIKTIKI